jgi:biotin carboxylase
MEEVNCLKKRVTLPVIFKPVDTSGSRGVIQVDSDEGGVWRDAFDYAKSFSRSGMVCIEEYVDGVDISGDGFLYEGELWAVITRKYKKGFIPTGHGLPTDLPQKQQQLVLDAVKLASDLCGYTNGPIDFDVRVLEDYAVVLEMSPRLGGNWIPAIIRRGTGVDLVEHTVLAALREKPSKPADTDVKNPCGSLIFGSEVSGRLVELADQNQIRKQVPEVFEYRTFLSAGDDVEPFIHSAHAVGYVLFDCPSTLSYEYLVKTLQTAIHMQVES